MNRKMVALLGLMVLADIDAEVLLMRLLSDYRKQERTKKRRNKNIVGSYNSKSRGDPSESESSEDDSESSDEEGMSSDVDIEDVEDSKVLPTEKVMIKSEPQDDLSDDDNVDFEDSDDDLFSETNANSSYFEKVAVKEETTNPQESNLVNNVLVKIESEEMIIDDQTSDKVLFASTDSFSGKQDSVQSVSGTNERSCSDQNATRLSSLVSYSVKQLKSKQSREKLERLIKKAIKDVTDEENK